MYSGLEVPGNDGEALLRQLSAKQDPVSTLSALRGPWACCFYQAQRDLLWFGRDAAGHRSLLYHAPTPACPQLTIASVAGSCHQSATSGQQAAGSDGLPPPADYPVCAWEVRRNLISGGILLRVLCWLTTLAAGAAARTVLP